MEPSEPVEACNGIDLSLYLRKSNLAEGNGAFIVRMIIQKGVLSENWADFNPLNAELNPIRHLLALAGARHIVHVSRITVKR